MTFAEARAAFPVLEHVAYLNAGTFGPLAHPTLRAIEDQQRRDGELGRSGPAYLEGVLALRERVRARLAAMIRVEPERLALTSSTTASCNIVVSGLGLTADDEVVTTDTEHFGLIGPLLVSGARVRIARVRDEQAEAVEYAIIA